MIILYIVTLVLLSIVCICFYKLYLFAKKNGGGAMNENCPKCGGILDKYGSCKQCGHSIIRGVSGATHYISSATWSSHSFSSISDTYGDNLDDEKTSEELLDDKYVDNNKLAKYVEWGYLKKTSDDTYRLTDRGKYAVDKNKKKIKKVD